MALSFTVHRREPELVGPAPAAATSCEMKRLSDIDDQEKLRIQVPSMFFYRGGPPQADDPVGVIRRALSEALVPYYPLAGRLREVEARKLVVDCTGEGVMFVEADADVRLAELEAAALRPPFPCMDQLLFDVEGSSGILNSPLLLIQVTRLLCGGFVFALRLNHTICDATGIAQFVTAVAELSRGLPAPTITPTWSRELLSVTLSDPDSVHDDAPPPPPPPPGDDDTAVVMRTFTFGPADLAAMKEDLPPRLRATATTFEVLTACLWRARTAALEAAPGEEARLVFIANIRGVRELELPAGYYGNGCVPVAVPTTAGALLAGSLGDAVEMVREAKVAVTAEYVQSKLEFFARRGRRPPLPLANMFLVSDTRNAGFHQVDFGWGLPVYGAPAEAGFAVNYYVRTRNGDGEDAVSVLLLLPRPAMARFATGINKMLTKAY